MKQIFLEYAIELKLPKGIKELKFQKSESVAHNGRNYTLYKICNQRVEKRALKIFACLAITFFSLGMALLSETFRNNWKKIFKNKIIKVYVFDKKNESTSSDSVPIISNIQNSTLPRSTPNTSSSVLNSQTTTFLTPENLPTSDPVRTDPVRTDPVHTDSMSVQIDPVYLQINPIHSEKDIPLLITEFPHASNVDTTFFPSPVPAANLKIHDDNLIQLLSRIPPHEGLNPHYLNNEDKIFLQTMIDKWNARVDIKKEWPLEELAVLFFVEVSTLSDFFYLLQIFSSETLLIDAEGLKAVLHSIENTITNKPNLATFNGGVKLIWNGSIGVMGQKNRFPKGSTIPFWNLQNLSMFLAVQEKYLILFLEKNNISPNSKGEVAQQDITKALNNATNADINDMLEGHRIQTNSLRFATARF